MGSQVLVPPSERDDGQTGRSVQATEWITGFARPRATPQPHERNGSYRVSRAFLAALPHTGRYADPSFGMLYDNWAIQDSNL